MKKQKKLNNHEKFMNIIDYFNGTICLMTTEQIVPYSIIYYNKGGIDKNTGFVYFNNSIIQKPTNDDLFDLLHEIGHIITNKYKMKRCIEEFLATKWAIENSSKFNVICSDKRFKEYQKYIYKWRETSIKHKAKNVPSMQQLTLQK